MTAKNQTILYTFIRKTSYFITNSPRRIDCIYDFKDVKWEKKNADDEIDVKIKSNITIGDIHDIILAYITVFPDRKHSMMKLKPLSLFLKENWILFLLLDYISYYRETILFSGDKKNNLSDYFNDGKPGLMKQFMFDNLRSKVINHIKSNTNKQIKPYKKGQESEKERADNLIEVYNKYLIPLVENEERFNSYFNCLNNKMSTINPTNIRTIENDPVITVISSYDTSKKNGDTIKVTITEVYDQLMVSNNEKYSIVKSQIEWILKTTDDVRLTSYSIKCLPYLIDYHEGNKDVFKLLCILQNTTRLVLIDIHRYKERTYNPLTNKIILLGDRLINNLDTEYNKLDFSYSILLSNIKNISLFSYLSAKSSLYKDDIRQTNDDIDLYLYSYTYNVLFPQTYSIFWFNIIQRIVDSYITNGKGNDYSNNITTTGGYSKKTITTLQIKNKTTPLIVISLDDIEIIYRELNELNSVFEQDGLFTERFDFVIEEAFKKIFTINYVTTTSILPDTKTLDLETIIIPYISTIVDSTVDEVLNRNITTKRGNEQYTLMYPNRIRDHLYRLFQRKVVTFDDNDKINTNSIDDVVYLNKYTQSNGIRLLRNRMCIYNDRKLLINVINFRKRCINPGLLCIGEFETIRTISLTDLYYHYFYLSSKLKKNPVIIKSKIDDLFKLFLNNSNYNEEERKHSYIRLTKIIESDVKKEEHYVYTREAGDDSVIKKYIETQASITIKDIRDFLLIEKEKYNIKYVSSQPLSRTVRISKIKSFVIILKEISTNNRINYIDVTSNITISGEIVDNYDDIYVNYVSKNNITILLQHDIYEYNEPIENHNNDILIDDDDTNYDENEFDDDDYDNTVYDKDRTIQIIIEKRELYNNDKINKVSEFTINTIKYPFSLPNNSQSTRDFVIQLLGLDNNSIKSYLSFDDEEIQQKRILITIDSYVSSDIVHIEESEEAFNMVNILEDYLKRLSYIKNINTDDDDYDTREENNKFERKKGEIEDNGMELMRRSEENEDDIEEELIEHGYEYNLEEMIEHVENLFSLYRSFLYMNDNELKKYKDGNYTIFYVMDGIETLPKLYDYKPGLYGGTLQLNLFDDYISIRVEHLIRNIEYYIQGNRSNLEKTVKYTHLHPNEGLILV